MLLESHLNRLTLAGYRPRTVSARRAVVQAFERNLTGRPLTDATRLDVESYLARPLAPQTRHAYLQHLRGFYRWCADEGYCRDATERVASVRLRKGTPRPMEPDDLDRALDAADLRMRAWLLLMAYAGLRCMEVAGLRPDDVLTGGSTPLLYLRETKGGGSGTVPAHPVVLEALAQLPVVDGRWWRVSAHRVTVATNAHLRSVGVASTAHSLRHYAATAWLRAGGHDLLAVRDLMRHASVSSTEVYARLDPVRPAEVVRLVRPSHLRVVDAREAG